MEQRRPLATTQEVADYLGVPLRTVETWAYSGAGPRYAKIGRHRRYRWEDVEAFVAAKVKGTAA